LARYFGRLPRRSWRLGRILERKRPPGGRPPPRSPSASKIYHAWVLGTGGRPLRCPPPDHEIPCRPRPHLLSDTAHRWRQWCSTRSDHTPAAGQHVAPDPHLEWPSTKVATTAEVGALLTQSRDCGHREVG
jgi:hypothetical protein